MLAFYRVGDVRWEVVPAVLIAGRVRAGLYLAAGRPLRIGRGDRLRRPAWHVWPRRWPSGRRGAATMTGTAANRLWTGRRCLMAALPAAPGQQI
jgi:hypothetical protein